jgi:hypothetical protein
MSERDDDRASVLLLLATLFGCVLAWLLPLV